MDGRLTRGVMFAALGGGLIFWGKGITDVSTDDNRGLGSAMIFAMVAGAYVILLAFCSLYDYATRPPSYE
ncbi:MAG: hypothetical protein V1909_04115 [Candidatus Micrarchaeota archaeon]